MRQHILALFLITFSGSAVLRSATYDVGSGLTLTSFSAAFTRIQSDIVNIPIPPQETITVNAYSGTYNESVAIPPMSQPLVVAAVPGNQVILSSFSQNTGYGMSVTGVASLTLQGITIENYQYGIFFQNCTVSTILTNTFINNSCGISILNCPGTLINGNTLLGNSTAIQISESAGTSLVSNQSTPYGSGGAYSSGLTLSYSNSCLVNKNFISNANNGISLLGCTGVTVSANAIMSTSGIEGISVDSSTGCWVYNNLSVGQQYGISIQESSNTGIHNNTVWGQISNGMTIAGSTTTQLLNNIIQGNDVGLFMDSSSQSSLNSQNNDLIAGNSIAVGASNYPTLASWQTTGEDSASISINPGFENASGTQPQNFMLSAGSQVEGQGQNLSSLFTTDYFDNVRPSSGAWDLGFDAISNITPPTPTPTATTTPILPTPTITCSFTATPTPLTSPESTATRSPTPSPTPSRTITPTFTATAYPIHPNALTTYPNPFNPSRGLPLNMVFNPSNNVSIKIFDMAGGFVADVSSSGINGSQGYATWDGRNAQGQQVAVGLYFAILRSSSGNYFTHFTVIY